MPHVIVEGPCRVESYHQTFEPLSRKEAGAILKTKTCYLHQDGSEALIESIVVDGGRPQTFFVSLLQRDDGILIRLLPLTDPEKTDGVKHLIVHIATQIIEQQPDCTYGQTNLQPLLPD